MALPNIAFVGRRGTGKDSIAARLVEHYGYRRMSWADPLRQIAAMAYDSRFSGSPEEYAAAKAATFEVSRRKVVDTGFTFEERIVTETITGTQVLQRIGTDAIRDNLDLDFWIKAGLRRLEAFERTEAIEAPGEPVRWVNTDTRFPNEADALRSRDWVIVGLSCPEPVRIARLIERDGFYDEAAQSHASETSLTLDDCDVVVDVSISIDKVEQRLFDLLTVDFGSGQSRCPGCGSRTCDFSCPD